MIIQNQKAAWTQETKDAKGNVLTMGGCNEIAIGLSVVPSDPNEHDLLEKLVTDKEDFDVTASFDGGSLNLAISSRRDVTLEAQAAQKAAEAKAAADAAAAEAKKEADAIAAKATADAEAQAKLNAAAVAVAHGLKEAGVI